VFGFVNVGIATSARLTRERVLSVSAGVLKLAATRERISKSLSSAKLAKVAVDVFKFWAI